MRDIIRFFKQVNYKELSVKNKLELLDNIESIVRTKDIIYGEDFILLKGFSKIYINKKGKLYNSGSKTKISILNIKSKRNMRIGDVSDVDLVKVYYETFIKELPEGYFIHSKSGKFLLNEDDLYINKKTPFENTLESGESYGQIMLGGIIYYITSKGRVYSLISKRYIKNHRSKSYVYLNNRNYFLGFLVRSAIEGNPHGFTDIVFKDGNPTNYSLGNTILVKDSLEYWLNKGEDYKYLPNDNYVVTNFGRVFSKYTGFWKELKQHINNHGYSDITLPILKGKNGKTWRVHRLVMHFYKGIDITNKEVNHIDQNKQNNSVDNLEVIEGIENIICYQINELFAGGLFLSFSEIKVAYNFFKKEGIVIYYKQSPSEVQVVFKESKYFTIFKRHGLKIYDSLKP